MRKQLNKLQIENEYLKKKQECPRALDRSPGSRHMMYWSVAKEISLKDISIFSSGDDVVQLNYTF